MPLLKLETTVVLSEDKRPALLASLSKIVAETIGKPQRYIMVAASQACFPANPFVFPDAVPPERASPVKQPTAGARLGMVLAC